MDSDTHNKKEIGDKPLTRTDVENLLREVGSTRELDLSDQNLSKIDLSKFDLTGAILNWADLSSANLSRADLNGASLVGANLRKANLREAKLHKAILRDVILNTGNQQEETSLSKTNLGWVILCRLNLKMNPPEPQGIDLSEANLNGANLREADLRGTNLLGASLIGADLSGANLSKASLKGALLNEADLSGANLSEANLREADLREADLSGANLIRANLSGAKLHQSTLFKADLREADLSGTDLIGADLREADLSGTDLIGADLSEASLIQANLSNAKLNRVKLNGALISKYQEPLLRDAGAIGLDKKHLFVDYLDNLEGMVRAPTIHIRIVEEPLTPHNLVSIISALTELSTKCWLIVQRRFADLINYTQTHDVRFAEEAGTVITRITYNSPFSMDWKVDLSAPSVAEAIVTTIDGITQRRQRLAKAELENQAKAQEVEQAKEKADQEQQMTVIEREKQELEVERQRLELLEKRLEVQKKGMEYALEIASKTVNVLHPSADAETRAMLIQTLLPNILQLQNGRGLELALLVPRSDEEKKSS